MFELTKSFEGIKESEERSLEVMTSKLSQAEKDYLVERYGSIEKGIQELKNDCTPIFAMGLVLRDIKIKLNI